MRYRLPSAGHAADALVRLSAARLVNLCTARRYFITAALMPDFGACADDFTTVPIAPDHPDLFITAAAPI